MVTGESKREGEGRSEKRIVEETKGTRETVRKTERENKRKRE